MFIVTEYAALKGKIAQYRYKHVSLRAPVNYYHKTP